jgi:hypothetical protein
MEDPLLMRWSPLALPCISNRWTMTSGGWEFNRVQGGYKNVFLKLQRTMDGYDNTGSEHPKRLCNTLLGRITRLEDQGLVGDFDAVYSGVRLAFNENIVRLQNPMLLLEHGMQICNPNLGALMFVMGLDVLFMAGETDSFMKRLGGFLGVDSYVFPQDPPRFTHATSAQCTRKGGPK